MNKHLTFLSALALTAGLSLQAQNVNQMVIQANKIGAEIQPTMYGHFFEDINYGADGGLYAELIKNRSFEFPQSFMGWNIFGNVTLQNDGPFERNPHYVRLGAPSHAHKRTGLENEGFFGIGIKANEKYRFTVWARGENQKIRVELIDNDSMDETQVITAQSLDINSKEWKKYELILTPTKTEAKAHLRIFLQSAGTVDLEHVSLFPVDTWKGRENGLRKDLVQALADTKPGIFRFPGGCIVEGTEISDRYNWKNSVGPVENRPLNSNRWHYTFPHRFFPDYFQTYGMGFYELFLLSEDMGAEPLPILNCGLACQYQNDDPKAHVQLCDLDSYIQDALDLIEFANGPVTSKWGKVRADMGHPEPFNLKMIGIGNEQWDKVYVERLEAFTKAIRAKYPNVKVVGSSGPSASGDKFDYLWPEMKRIGVDLVDEHYYMNPDWFFGNASRYDNYDRKGPKVFAGEYASHDHSTKKDNNFLAALSEAAFMTGLERNADVVHLATYAPLFAHVDAWQWNPDLIWFDNLRMMRTPNYYVQQMYGMNAGTDVLSLKMDGKAVVGQDSLYATAALNAPTGEIILKLVNASSKPADVQIDFNGLKKRQLVAGSCTYLQNDNWRTVNTLDQEAIVPRVRPVQVEGQSLKLKLEPRSFGVYRIQ